jgi:hypothetical protein
MWLADMPAYRWSLMIFIVAWSRKWTDGIEERNQATASRGCRVEFVVNGGLRSLRRVDAWSRGGPGGATSIQGRWGRNQRASAGGRLAGRHSLAGSQGPAASCLGTVFVVAKAPKFPAGNLTGRARRHGAESAGHFGGGGNSGKPPTAKHSAALRSMAAPLAESFVVTWMLSSCSTRATSIST